MILILPGHYELVEFVLQSNLIEGEPADTEHPLFQSHLEACWLVIEALNAGWGVPHPQEIHRVLMAPEPHKLPGQYRPPHDPKKGVSRVDREPLVPAHLIPGRMVDLWDRIRRGPCERDISDWAWDVHDEFELIHPFMDGNGRTGRMLMNGLLLTHGLQWLTIRFEDREQYFKRFR